MSQQQQVGALQVFPDHTSTAFVHRQAGQAVLALATSDTGTLPFPDCAIVKTAASAGCSHPKLRTLRALTPLNTIHSTLTSWRSGSCWGPTACCQLACALAPWHPTRCVACWPHHGTLTPGLPSPIPPGWASWSGAAPAAAAWRGSPGCAPPGPACAHAAGAAAAAACPGARPARRRPAELTRHKCDAVLSEWLIRRCCSRSFWKSTEGSSRPCPTLAL